MRSCVQGRSFYPTMARGVFANLTQTPAGDFALRSSYDPGFVAALKRDVPTSERRWDGNSKVWLISPRSAGVVAGLVTQYYGLPCSVKARAVTPRSETKLVRMEYLGTAKDRGGPEPVAFGYADGDWTLALPLSVLKGWFGVGGDDTPGRPGDASTLYAVLAVSKKATPEEIKAAYRRLARQWHPDVCHEPDAKEQFLRIKAAYDVLSDPGQRQKYNLGLAFADSIGRAESYVTQLSNNDWRPPLRCGWLLVEGVLSLGRLQVSQILGWEDITDPHGRVMVSSWPAGATTFDVQWV